MPFPYRYICDLLQQLDDESRKEEKKQKSTKAILEAWFCEHRSNLGANESDASAILSTLLPERRTDRVYSIQVMRLESIFGKALLLGVSRVQELRRYQTPGLGVDLADCIEGILKRTPNPPQGNNEFTVEELDDTLTSIAAVCRFSSPSVKVSRRSDAGGRDQPLIDIYRRLSPRDAKWFTRLILKNYRPVVMDERSVLRLYHPLLPQMMKVRDDLSMATTFLRQISQSPCDQNSIASIIKPSIGTKIGRQLWFKGRSMKHCLDMGKSREMSCEQKIDGEYCQIHIDLRKSRFPIQIFSKSGKDSTADRVNLHQPIKDSLKLGTPNCPFKVGCILEGELVLYSDKDNKILPFHKIRKHVSRSGAFMGTYHDSQPHDYEHLMIVYYDVLMIDDESLLGVRQSERFRRLSELITCRKGYAELVQREVISFARPTATRKLREAFAKCIISRNEGLVLKPNEPYFDFSSAQRSYSCCNIKLKKEYVQGWGDVGDFAVVGASYDAAKAREYKKTGIKWTHFFIGCLDNKEKAQAGVEKPRFIITNIVELPEALLLMVMTQCFPSPVEFGSNQSMILDFGWRGINVRPTDVFLEPLVCDVRCFSFDKEPNTNFWSMRFPMVSKIHHDRSYWDTITFAELQEVAINATEAPELEDSQEMRQWISALEKADPRGIAVDAISQESIFTETRTSPVPRRENLQKKDVQRVSILGPTGGCPEDIVGSTRNPLALPRLPVVEGSEHHVPSNTPLEPRKISSCQKRPAPDIPRAVKKSRKSPVTPSTQLRSAEESASSPPSSQRSRKALSQIDANSQSRILDVPLIDLTTSDTESPPTGNCCEPLLDPSLSVVPNVTHTVSSFSKEQDNSKFITPKCSFAGQKCALENCSILLSPCISQYAWVTDDLLRQHGINNFLVDPEVWSQIDTTPRPASKGGNSPRKICKLKARKICLVESRRRDATMSFYGKIEAAGLKKKNGEREWVGVYDWRLLEDILDLESGRKPRGMDPWRKHYVGIA